jgi:hypothetical protein
MKITEIVHEVVDGLRHHPVALAVILVNLMCTLLVAFLLYNVASRSQAKDQLIAELARRECK